MCLEHKQYWQCCLTVGSKYIDPCPNAQRGLQCKKDQRVHPLEGYCPECFMSRDEHGDDVVTRPMYSRNDSYDRPWNGDYEVPPSVAYQTRRPASPSAQTERGRRSRRLSSPSPEPYQRREYSYHYSDRPDSSPPPPPAVPEAPMPQMSWSASSEISQDEIDDEYHYRHQPQPQPQPKYHYAQKSKSGSKHKKARHKRREQQYIEDRYVERFLAPPSSQPAYRSASTTTISSSLPSRTLRSLQNSGALSSGNIYVVSSPRDVQYLQQQGILPSRGASQRLLR